MPDSERRQHRRLPLRLPLAYRPAGMAGGYEARAVTANISTTGTYFEAPAADLHEGMALHIALTVPPADGISPYTTEISAAGEVVRVVRLPKNKSGKPGTSLRAGIAVRFSRSLQYQFPA
ncbi:MAG: PilZ domain-containing protein [Phycisphaerales bacterium]|nr:MAG: PilZ domain-containing protein [Phycisphaerales bacterium]